MLPLILLALAAADPYRPVFHFTPPQNWMNDPNGLVYFDGEYHLFYQHNPFGNKWGHMSWGHAVSRDLLRWQHLPVAIPEADGVAIFSGSAVVDSNNTSGLCPAGKPCLVAIYTGQTAERQHQNLAWSHDRGRTWTKYSGNPVLDIGMKDFRDPKVIWHERTRRWIMVVALPKEKKVRFYASPDLRSWVPLSDFGPAGATGGIWECPDLFELDGHWVLVVNLNPGAPAGGSGGQYFLGHFDGKTFTPSHTDTRWIDYGKDMYATVSFFGTPGRHVWLGWMSNWQYAGDEPTATWRTAQSIPRELRILNKQLVQTPVRELTKYRRPAQLKDFTGDSYEIEAALEPGSGFNIRGDTQVGVRPGEVYITRTGSFHKAFAGTHAAPANTSKPVKVRILVDRSSVEVFIDGGRATLTDRIFPNPSDLSLRLFGDPRDVQLWRIHF